jgi:diacylglycerol kinase
MKFLRSFGYALKGLITAFTQQRNLKIHGAVLLCVIGVGLYLRVELLEWCGLLLAAALVLVTELVNTSIEELVNLISPQHHPGRVSLRILPLQPFWLPAFLPHWSG